MNGCMCGCRGQRCGAERGPGREDRIRWLEATQRGLEQQMAKVAEEISRLKEGPQPAS